MVNGIQAGGLKSHRKKWPQVRKLSLVLTVVAEYKKDYFGHEGAHYTKCTDEAVRWDPTGYPRGESPNGEAGEMNLC